jgi:hypothetical protein
MAAARAQTSSVTGFGTGFGIRLSFQRMMK